MRTDWKMSKRKYTTRQRGKMEIDEYDSPRLYPMNPTIPKNVDSNVSKRYFL